MAESLENLSFDRIRPWRGSQDRAFEELSFQLLKDEIPPGCHAIRTGNPDGGVEWYAELPTGEHWGWQAKNVRDIETLLSGMTESVKQVASERQNLVRLTFVISKNLNTGTAKGKWKSERAKYEDKINTWHRTISGADRIEFRLVQESDLLDKLTLPQHQGRVWFWWNQASFGRDWLKSLYEHQRIVAGEKYRPDLQVDLPISEDLKGLGFSQSFTDDFRSLSNRLVKVIDALGEIELDDEALDSGWQEVRESTRPLAVSLSTCQPFSEAVQRFESLTQSVRKCEEASFRVERRVLELRRDCSEISQTHADPKRQSLDFLFHEVRSLGSTLSELRDWLSHSPAQAARKRLYFLTGPAGSGKTHLFLDSVRVAIDENRPAVVLFGARFGDGDIWASITEQLGLGQIGRDVLLGAMESAAQAADIDDRRFLILIDALNETMQSRFWEIHLPELRAAILHYPHLAIAVSCRDTYLDVIDPGAERTHFAMRTHPGFGGREVEATHKYFVHYGLEAPRIPLLVPEFTVPLFLRLYCESLRDSGKAAAAVGHEGRIAIFERYLNVKVALIAREVFPPAKSSFELGRNQDRVRAVLDALLDGMASADAEWLSVTEAEGRAAASLEDDKFVATRVIGAFENEGLLIREPLYLVQQTTGAGIRVTFQAFSDFLLLRRRLRESSNPLEDQGIRDWLLTSASWGIVEAAAVLLPEMYDVELPDFLALTVGDLQLEESQLPDEHARVSRARHILRSIAETLPYRRSSSIGRRTIDLLNDALQTVLPAYDFYRILFMTAPQIGNPLNGVGLHNHLSRMRMPERDASFGFAVYDELWEESSPLARLARWAALGPYPTYTNEVIELGAIPLIWLLSSPNRFMRDWVTKALVQLLHGHLDVMRALFERFWDVDDPYVVQRVVLVAYGCLMRGGSQDTEQAGLLASAVLEQTFRKPIRPDGLMLESARGIIEWAVAFRILPDEALGKTKRPYDLTKPGNPPTFETLKERFDRGGRHPDEESYWTVFSSLFVMGDFGRYVVDSHVGQFSRYTYGQTIPKVEGKERQFRTRRWNKFLRSLTAAQFDAVEKSMQLEQVDRHLAILHLRNGPPGIALTKEQRALLASVYKPVTSRMDYAYPSERALRWVFKRTLSLGWTPQLFGMRDRIIDRPNIGRDAHKAERWGKKYQWIAFHELISRIADNFQPLWEDDDIESTDSLPLMTRFRDIDPSLPPVNYREFLETQGESASSWSPSPIALSRAVLPRIEFQSYRGDVTSFIADEETMPSLPGIAMVSDDAGLKWIALNGFDIQREIRDDWNRSTLQQTTWLWTAFVSAESASSLAEDLKKTWGRTFREPSAQGHSECCYAGEIGWSPRSCIYKLDAPRTVKEGGFSVEVIDTSEDYAWSATWDCSIADTVKCTFPSTYILRNANLRTELSSLTWTNEDGEVVAFYHHAKKDRSAMTFARLDWLQEFLRQMGVSLAVLTRFDRILMDPNRTEPQPRLNVWSSAVLNKTGPLQVVGDPIRLDEMW